MQMNPEREIIPEVETLTSGAKITRYGKIRILIIEGKEPLSAGVLDTLSVKDRPSSAVRNVIGTYLPFRLGLCTIGTNGTINVQYSTTYGGSFENVPTGTYVYGEVIWAVS